MTKAEVEQISCEVCRKPMQAKIKVVFYKRKTCSDKCRQIAWALREANKVMKEKK